MLSINLFLPTSLSLTIFLLTLSPHYLTLAFLYISLTITISDIRLILPLSRLSIALLLSPLCFASLLPSLLPRFLFLSPLLSHSVFTRLGEIER